MREINEECKKHLEMSGVIAERVLHFQNDPASEIVVRIGMPTPVQLQRVVYQCTYSITGLGKDTYITAEGIDSAQALVLALEMLSADLLIYNRDHPKKLRFLDDADVDLGFPVSMAKKMGVNPT